VDQGPARTTQAGRGAALSAAGSRRPRMDAGISRSLCRHPAPQGDGRLVLADPASNDTSPPRHDRDGRRNLQHI